MNNNLDVNKISAEVITDLAKTTAQTLYQKVRDYVTDIQKKEEIDFGLNIKKEVQEEKII